MPAVSKSQFRFFKFLENNPSEAKKHGMTSEKAKEYTSENKSLKGLPEKVKLRARKKV